MSAQKCAVITGAASGIGRSIAIAFARERMNVVVCALPHDDVRAEQTVDAISGEGGSAQFIPCDVTDEAQVKALMHRSVAAFDTIDILVNAAGILDQTPLTELTKETWNKVLETNATGALLCAREVWPVMTKKGGGRIINIGSIAALFPSENSPAYTSSKFALSGLSRSLALDGRSQGISVSIIHPGATTTALKPGVTDVPSKARMSPETIAEVALMIARLPDNVELLEVTVFPLSSKLLGRG